MDRAQLQRPQTAIHLGFPYSYSTGWREVSPLKERVNRVGHLNRAPVDRRLGAAEGSALVGKG